MPRCWCSSASSASGGSLRRSSPRLGALAGQKRRGPERWMKRDVVLSPPCPFVYGVAGLLSSRVLAWHPWIGELSLDATHAAESRCNRAAIALGDKSNLRNPRSGTAHPRQKEMGQLPSRTEKQKRNVLLARLHGTDRGRLVTTYLPSLRLPSIKPASSSSLVPNPNPPLSAR
jgi:hypothetical protein